MAELELPPGLVPLEEEDTGGAPLPPGLVPLDKEVSRPSLGIPEGLISPESVPGVLPDRNWRNAYEEATAKRSDEILISPEQARLIAERNTSRPQTFTQGGLGGVLTNLVDRVDRPRAAVVGAAVAGMEGADWKAVGQELLLGMEGKQHPLTGDYIFYKIDQAQKDPDKYPGTTKIMRLLDAAGLEPTQAQALLSTLGGIGGDIALDPLTYTGLGTTRQGAATMIKSSLSKEGVEITNPELNKILKDMEARGEFTEYGKTLAEQFERGQKQYKVAGVPVPKHLSAAVVHQLDRLKDKVKATKLGDTTWRMFSTKHGLLPEHEKFAVMEERFKNVVIMGREHSVKENKFLMKEIQKISKDTGVAVKDINSFITEAVERGNLHNIDLAKVDQRAVDTLMANDDVMNTAVKLRFKNTQQIKEEVNAGIQIVELGAMEQKHLSRIDEAVAAAKANGLPQTVNPVTGRKIATATLEKKAGALRERIAVQEKLFYMNHSLTPEARGIVDKIAKKTKHKATDAGREYSVQHASTLQRNFRDMSIVEINSLAKRGKLPGYEGVTFPNGFFYDDPAIAQAYRDFRHGRAMAAADMLSQARKEFGISSQELLALKKKTKAASIDEVIPEGYVKATHPLVKDTYFPVEIANRIDAHFTAIHNPAAVNEYLQLYDQATGWWKAWTLSIFPGYHTRNAAGNVWNNFVTGTKDPRVYATATAVQKGGNGHIKTVDGRTISYDQIRENLDMLGVRNRGLFTADIEQSLKEELGGGRWLTLSRDQKAIHIGRKVGETIENNARIAKFVDELEKGKSFFDASKATQRALFDYSDLTQFEQKVAKRLLPFWTWSRKNIPLQAQQLVAHPGRYKAVDTIRREIEANTPDQGEYNMANYMLDNYPTRVRIDKESGNPEYFLLGSWLPAADLWKVASDPGKLGLDLLHPGAKAALEYGFGVDLFTMKELDPDKQEDFLGVKMDPRVKKALSNMRIITTIDDLIFSTARPEHLLATTRNMTLEEKMVHFATGVKLYSQDPMTNKMFKIWEKGARLKELRKDQKAEFLKHQDPDQLDDMTQKMIDEYLENFDEILSGTGRP